MKLRDFHKLVCLGVFLILGSACVALAQDPVPPLEGMTPDSEWLYSKHLEQVQGIMKEADLSVRAQKLENYTRKLDPAAKIRPYMEGFLLQTAEDLSKAGKAAEAKALTDKVAQLFPNSTTLLARAMTTAFQAGDYAKAIEAGEKLYAANPDRQVLAVLAQSSIASKDATRAVQYSEKLVAELGPKDGVYFLAWLADYYASQRNTEKALALYGQMLEAFPEGVPPGWDAAQWNAKKATAFALRANVAYAAKDCPGAINNFTESLKYYAHNDTAYYLMGMCLWQAQKYEEAEQSLAKAVVLNKASSARARERLDQLWKSRHNNTTDGLDALLAKVKTELKL